MPSEHQVQVAARIINEVCRPGYRAALNLADRVLRAVEGQWATATGSPDHDGLTGKPFAGPTPVPCDHERELRRLRHVETDLISLSWQMHDAVGDKGPGPGSPRQYLDMLIAERDAVAAQVKLLMDEVEHLRGRQAVGLSEPGPAHGLEILSETIASDDVTALSVLCPRSGCVYGASIQAPTAEVAHRMVEALAVAHEEEMEEEPDAEG